MPKPFPRERHKMKTTLSISIIILLGIASHITTNHNKITKPLHCVEHAMIDGLPYCGVYRSNGALYEVTMSDIRESEEVLSYEQ